MRLVLFALSALLILCTAPSAEAGRYMGILFHPNGSGVEVGNTNAISQQHLVAFSFIQTDPSPDDETNDDQDLQFNLKFGFDLGEVKPCFENFYLTASGGVEYRLTSDADFFNGVNIFDEYKKRKWYKGVMAVGAMLDLNYFVFGFDIDTEQRINGTIGVRF